MTIKLGKHNSVEMAIEDELNYESINTIQITCNWMEIFHK